MELPHDAELPGDIELRDLNDHDTARKQIFEQVRKATENAFPVTYGGVRLELENVRYDNEKDYDVDEQKHALLHDKFLTRKLRGTFKLYEEETNRLLDKKTTSIMKVPWLTQRGTFVNGGNEYFSIFQSRLLPGVYTRRQANGHLETQYNLKPGTGNGFRIGFEPDTAQYRLKISQANLHLYSLLHDLGMSDEELEQRWGPDVFKANQNKYDSRVFEKAYARLVPVRGRKPDATRADKIKAIQAALDTAQVHKSVVAKNLPGMMNAKAASEQRAVWAGREVMRKQAEELLDAVPFEPDYSAEEVLQNMWELEFDKQAAAMSGSPVQTMRKAKEYSDSGQYKRKATLMLLLMQSHPDEFVIDSDDPKFPGITHKPSGFRMHVPKDIIPAEVAGQTDALDVKKKSKRRSDAATDPAKGIPDRNEYGDIDKLQTGQLLDYISQIHEATRAGTHRDIRLGNSELGLYSWATKKPLEQLDSGPIELHPQPMHEYSYKDYEGDIPAGSYGAGSVKKEFEKKVLVTRISPNAISFATGGKYPTRFSLVRPTEGHRWLMVKGKTPDKLRAEKQRYKDVSKQSIEEIIASLEPGSIVQPKIDGALAFLQMENQRPEIMSHRTSKVTGKPIFHSERFYGALPKLYDLPSDLRDVVARGELYGTRDGKSIPAHELGGILNSSLEKSLEDQRSRNIQLKAMLFDVAYAGGQDLSTRPYSERRALLERLLPYLPKNKFELPPQATTPEDILKMYETVGTGEHPLTEEGLVIHPPSGVPSKMKLFDDYDVHVRNTFPGEGRLAEMGVPGGFEYSLEPDGPIVGRVGTGFSDEVRKQLPEYVGRVAKIRAQRQLPSGAYQSPRFHSLHEDY